MKNRPSSPSVSIRNRAAFEIALLYLTTGVLWILFSDKAAARFAPSQAILTQVSIYKGWGYVLVTALLLYWMIRLYTKRIIKTEWTLSENEKNYQELLQQASDGILIADAKGQYTIVNEEACRLVGYTKDELLSMNLRELVAPEDLNKTPLRLEELHAGKALITERKLLRKDGSRIVCEISAKILTDGRYQSIIRDITERKVTEDALRRSERRYRSLFENMTNGFARCQMLYENEVPNDFIYLDINDAFKKLTGLQDVIGKHVSAVIPGIRESNPELFEIYGRVASTGKPEKFETYIPDLGSGIWFSVSVYSTEKGFFVAVFETITERKQAEESLRQSYKQLLSFIDHAPLSIAMFDLDMNYLATSRRWILDFGRGHTDLIGRNHYDIHPDVPDYWREAHQKGLAGESLKNDDDLWIQTDGTKNWLRWALTPWTDEHGKVGGIIISTEDISERKRAEAAAFKSELRYRRILDALMEGCQVIDSDWRYVYVNEAVVQQGKRKPEEMLNHTMMATYPGIEQTEMFSVLRQCVEDRAPKRMENQFVFPDGSIEWFELSILPVEEDIFILSTDITKRKQTEDALRESEERLRLSLRAANQGLYDLNVQTGDAVVNREYAEMLGYNFDSFVETNAAWIERLHPDDREGTAKTYTDYINGLTPEYRVEFRQRTKDGGWKWLLSLGKVVEFDAAGKPLRMLGTHTDITARKKAEEALQKAHDELELQVQLRTRALSQTNILLETMLENTPDQIYFKDAKSRFIRNSRAQAVALGVSDPAQVIGKTDFDFFPHAQQSYDEEQEIIRSGQPLVDFEERVAWPNGQETWVSTTKVPLRDQTGQIIGTFGISRDITGRKRNEAALLNAKEELEFKVAERTTELRETNEQLQRELSERKQAEAQIEYQAHLLENVSEAIIATDEKQMITSWNRGAENLYGWKAAETIGKPAQQIIRSKFSELQRAEAVKTLAETGDLKVEVVQYHRNGQMFWAEGHTIAIRDDTGKITGFVAINRDITDRQQAEEALHRSQENFAKAFNSNPAAIAITRLTDGKFININPAYTSIMEYEPHEILDHTATEINIYVHPEERDQVIKQLREQGSVQNYELLVRVKSGETRNIVISMEPLLYNEEECILSVFIDISERQKMEAELQRSNAELEQFAYIASHDLQEPLRAVAGMVQLLGQRYQGKLDERADEYIGHAVEASARMQRLINDLLDYSRLNRDKKLLEPTDLENCLKNALANLQVPIAESQAQITHAPLPTLKVNAAQMIQLLQNLIGNAIKFRGARPLHIHIGAEKIEHAWQFTVRDNGIGIEPQYFERIFLVFQRLHTRREYPGTGIGLALCKKIIERHGGQVWVESQPGQGSIFYFTIPER